jgi:hypothetical protein
MQMLIPNECTVIYHKMSAEVKEEVVFEEDEEWEEGEEEEWEEEEW